MGFLTDIVLSFVNRDQYSKDRKKSNYILYRIIDYVPKREEYILQCINKKAVFYSKLAEIISDIDILYGLHPIQACYIGIRCSEYLRKTKTNILAKNSVRNSREYEVCRYGRYFICSEDRKRNIYFTDHDTHEKFLMDPCDISVIKNLIQEFDATHAFHIGLLAGYKLNKKYYIHEEKYKNTKLKHLSIVKK